MKFKKLFVILSLLLILGIAAGCAELEDGFSPSNINNGQKSQVTIEVWNNQRHNRVVKEELIKHFNETNPYGITVNYRVFSDNYPEIIKLASETDELPDLIFNPSIDKQESMLPINDWITPEIKSRFDEAAFEYQDGKIFGIKEEITSFKMVYNKNLFEASGLDPDQPPKTWAQVREYAQIITDSGGGQKFGIGLPIETKSYFSVYLINPFYRSGEIYGMHGWNARIGEYDFLQFLKPLQWWIDVKEDGSIFPGVGKYDNDMIRAQFSEGNIGMLMAASWDIGVFNYQYPAKIDWGVFDFPTWDGEVKGAEFYNISSFAAINKNTKYPKEIKKVWEFFISDKMYVESAKAGMGYFTNKAAQNQSLVNTNVDGMEGFTLTKPALVYPKPPELDFSGIKEVPSAGGVKIIDNAVKWDALIQIFHDGQQVEKKLEQLSNAFNAVLQENMKENKVDLSDHYNPDFSPLYQKTDEK